jgi:hypothetical protein
MPNRLATYDQACGAYLFAIQYLKQLGEIVCEVGDQLLMDSTQVEIPERVSSIKNLGNSSPSVTLSMRTWPNFEPLAKAVEAARNALNDVEAAWNKLSADERAERIPPRAMV